MTPERPSPAERFVDDHVRSALVRRFLTLRKEELRWIFCGDPSHASLIHQLNAAYGFEKVDDVLRQAFND